jgi:2-phosphoglycerate kinase
VSDEHLHRGHFGHRRGERPPERYLRSFDSIRELQAHLAERAAAEGVEVIENDNVDEALGHLMQVVLDTVGRIGEEGK